MKSSYDAPILRRLMYAVSRPAKSAVATLPTNLGPRLLSLGAFRHLRFPALKTIVRAPNVCVQGNFRRARCMTTRLALPSALSTKADFKLRHYRIARHF